MADFHPTSGTYFLILILLLSFSNLRIVLGCGYGAPQVPQVCRRMMPNHGVPGQNSPSPYTLTLDKTKVKPGEDVTLTIGGGGGPPFKGFLVEARMTMRYGGSNPFPMGSFKPGASHKLLGCGGIPDSAATHMDPQEKGSISLVWTAPEVLGNYTLLVTVAKAGDTFWVAQPSPGIEVVYCVKPQ